MQNPIIRNRKRKRINRFVKYFYGYFLLFFVLSVISYKTGNEGVGLRPTYYKATPITWKYVFDHLPEIVVFSLGVGLIFTLTTPLSDN